MNQEIGEIITAIPQGCIFDSHFIIARLIKLHPSDYLLFAGSNVAVVKKTPITHGLLAKQLNSFRRRGVISRLEFQSYSENITGKPSKCACWIKQ